jgi:spermidine synthase
MENSISTAQKPVHLISAIFFLSGCSALIFETVWFRTTSIVLGSSIWSAAAVLMAFMAGLGLGNAVMAFRGDKVTYPLRLYIVIEIVIGISGVLAIFLLPKLSPIIARGLAPITDHGSLLNFFRFCTAFVVLLFPSIAMGMTIPLLQKYLHGQKYYHQFSRSLGILYGFNTLGAVSGALIAEFIMIKLVGIKGTGLLAMSINLVIVLILLRTISVKKETQIKEVITGTRSKPLSLKLDLIPPFLAGFLLLALEVIWFRYMLLAHSGTSEVFALMLAIVLAGIGVGGLIGAKISVNQARLQLLTLALPLLGALTVVLCFYFFDKIFTHYFVELDASLTVFTLAALVLMLPSCIISGVLFTLFGECLYQRFENTTQATGVLTLTNTMGAAIGSGVATFVLLPELGIEKSILLLSAGYVLVAIFVYHNRHSSEPAYRGYIPVVVTLLLLVVLFPFGALEKSYQTFSRLKLPGDKLIAVREGMNETLQYYQTERFNNPLRFRLVTNSFSMSGNDFASKRYMKLYAYFPYVFNREIRDVLQISYGVGSTAEAITDLNSVEHFDVVDISRDILDMSSIIHATTGKFPLQDKRTQIHLEDGRFFLQTTSRKYDLITGEPPPPKNAGIVNLYTREYFELIRAHLNSKGMVTYWLPAHDLNDADSLAIIKAFCEVFEDCSLWNGGGLDFMMVGVKDGIDPISAGELEGAWDSEIGRELELIGLENPDMFGTMFMADSKLLKKITLQIKPVTDNFPHRISPSNEGLRDFSSLYAGLLNIERRKDAYRNSEYISRLFSEETIDKTLDQFEHEGLMTHLLVPLYGTSSIFYWEKITALLLETDLKVLPLLLLNSSPEEEFLISQVERDTESGLIDTQEYQMSYIKHLIVGRDFKQAAVRFEHYLNTFSIRQDKAVYIKQLFILTNALACNITAKDLNTAFMTDTPSMDEDYKQWFVQRFSETNKGSSGWSCF